jgi:hypothetical protein
VAAGNIPASGLLIASFSITNIQITILRCQIAIMKFFINQNSIFVPKSLYNC